MTDTPDVTTYTDSPHAVSAHESGMTFESAMDAVKLGHAVRREAWPKWRRIVAIWYHGRGYIAEREICAGGRIYVSKPVYYTTDTAASDWKVVDHPTLWDPNDETLGDVWL